MVFRSDDDYDDEEEELELVMFQGALNGKNANLAANARLASAGLMPAKELISDALARRAEQIRVEPKGERSIITFVVDGISYAGGRIPKSRAQAITQILKLLSGLDVKQRSKPQSGGIKAEFEEKKFELRVESKPIAPGAERLTISATDLSINLHTPADIGMPENLRDKIRDVTGEKEGLLIICGPPFSGTTTTIYATLKCVDSFIYTIFTVVDPGSRDIHNITKFDVQPEDDLETTIDRIARVEADVIFLNPIRNEDAAKAVISKCTKVALIAEMRAKETAVVVAQIAKWVGDPDAVAAGLKGVVTQKLIRKLCPKCREAYRPNPRLLARIGLPKDVKVLYRKPKLEFEDDEPLDCRVCGGIGYIGRVAMFEYLEMTEDMQAVVSQKPDPASIRAQVRREKMLTLQKDGIRLVADGTTSLEELQRIFKSS